MNGLILSIFPGIDLLGRAFEEEGYCVVRGPDLLWGGDIRRFHPPPALFEGVIGGPPCPDFSPLRHLIAAHGYKSKHGNLIPEFERVVAEAQPDWFLMEEGVFAPDAEVSGYRSHGFFLCPTWLGEEQSRKRKLCFGMKGEEVADLRDWIDYAIFRPLIPARGVLGDGDVLAPNQGKIKQPAVMSHTDPYPVAIGGSGKPKVTRAPVLTSGQPTYYEDGKVKKARRRSLEECLHLQGLPEDFFGESPLTMEAKRRLVGNGVAMSVGRVLAKAVKKATS